MSKEQTKLRGQFYKETGTHWENSQGEPDIDYVVWLEAKIISSKQVVSRSACDHTDENGYVARSICIKCGKNMQE